jgi:hypothetical protein
MPAACIRIWASVKTTFARSASLIPSTLLGSNIRLICLPEVGAGASCCFIDFLPCDSIIALGACGSRRRRDQPLQIGQRQEINLWRTQGHPDANHRIKHPGSHRNYDTRRTLHLKKLARRSMLYPPDADLAAKIGMPTVMNLQLLTDMGRMNGQWP